MALIFSISSHYWPTFNFSIIVSLHTSFLSKPFTLDPTIFTPIFPPNADEDSIKTSSSLFTSRGSFHPQDISTNFVSIYPAVKKMKFKTAPWRSRLLHDRWLLHDRSRLLEGRSWLLDSRSPLLEGRSRLLELDPRPKNWSTGKISKFKEEMHEDYSNKFYYKNSSDLRPPPPLPQKKKKLNK